MVYSSTFAAYFRRGSEAQLMLWDWTTGKLLKTLDDPALFSLAFISASRVLLARIIKTTSAQSHTLHAAALHVLDLDTGTETKYDLPELPCATVLQVSLEADHTSPASNKGGCGMFAPARGPYDRIILWRMVHQDPVLQKMTLVISCRAFGVQEVEGTGSVPWAAWGPAHTRFTTNVPENIGNIVDGRWAQVQLRQMNGEVWGEVVLRDFSRARVANASVEGRVVRDGAMWPYGAAVNDDASLVTTLPFVVRRERPSEVPRKLWLYGQRVCEDGYLYVGPADGADGLDHRLLYICTF
ncbi:hypothetical protein K488DRAFT_85806 [Vararia minispora EC-137]|uniref:Uncharacterized protein n=1 Tax=Vararia minispora EC-137 TaxID=1314806 RepID=A0ACB8QM89_9AGAM|nr:hypothetical protein K488DRAFT_85806 [Vararia minispora EC-137]